MFDSFGKCLSRQRKMAFHQPPCRWSGFTTWLYFDALFLLFTAAEICKIGRKYRKCSLVGSTIQPEHNIMVPKCLLASMVCSFLVSIFFFSKGLKNRAEDSSALIWAFSRQQAAALTTLAPSEKIRKLGKKLLSENHVIHWNRPSRKAVELPFLDVFKNWRDVALRAVS